MKNKKKEQGNLLLTVLIIMFLLNSILFISLTRSESSFRLLKNRYLNDVARNLAENGIEFERFMISKGKHAGSDSPHKRDIGMFAKHAGSFESYASLIEEDVFEIVSKGKLSDQSGRLKFSICILARISCSEDGAWKITGWSEQG
ncbi:MAG: hypothetical protein GY795_39120 [Desulfobacterales bacterium]|nr:hypothetical protein [Desulfobacterales bacterium]